MMIPRETMRKMIKQQTQMRVGPEACDELAYQLEQVATTIIGHAEKLARHNGRVTILPEDILLAVELLEEE